MKTADLVSLNMAAPVRIVSDMRDNPKTLNRSGVYIYNVYHHHHLFFENVAFFHAKLWSDVCPRVDNQTSGDTTRFNVTISGKNHH